MKSRGISGAPWDVFGLLVVLVMICLGTHKAAGDDTTATPAAIDKDWWRKTAVYQIYPRSFYDLTNKDGTNVPDGIGDLKGITAKLDYVKDLGMGAIWLSPFFKSPMHDFGYDIEDFTDIHDEFGTMADFDTLSARAKELGIRLLLDFVPGHTSHLHKWFKDSVNRRDPYTDFYVWHKGQPDRNITVNGKSIPAIPNNWESVPGGTMWEWHETRQEYYLHQFLPQQPDLNYRNEALCKEMDDVLRFWLDKGVAGFRVDAIQHLFEIPQAEMLNKDEHNGMHPYTKDLPETPLQTKRWREVLNNHSKVHYQEPKLLIFEVYADMDIVKQYYTTADEPSLAFNFKFISSVQPGATGKAINDAVQDYLGNVPKDFFQNWVTGNHDQKRVSTRLGNTNLVDGWNMVNLLLPGMPTTYFGEEIGMRDIQPTADQVRDPFALNSDGTVKPDWVNKTRDYSRSPMQWTSGTAAGFSTNPNTWLPLGVDYRTINVQKQEPAGYSQLVKKGYAVEHCKLPQKKEQKNTKHTRIVLSWDFACIADSIERTRKDLFAPQCAVQHFTDNEERKVHQEQIATRTVQSEASKSSLKVFKEIAALRKKNAFMKGTMSPALVTEEVYSFVRKDGTETYIVALDVRKEGDAMPHDFTSVAGVCGTASVAVAGYTFEKSANVTLNAVVLRPSQSVVLNVHKPELCSSVSPLFYPGFFGVLVACMLFSVGIPGFRIF